MSWQAYVDNNLVGTGKVTKAAIIGAQGGVWASSPGLQITPEEQQAIIAAFKDLDLARSSGIRISGVKYFTTTAEENTIIGKKGADGVVLCKTKQAILVAIQQPPAQTPETANVTEALAEYLRSVNY